MTSLLRWTARILGAAVLLVVLALGGLMLASPGDLKAWNPPEAGPQPKTAVLDAQVVGEGACEGPGRLAVDAAGRPYALCAGDGDIVMFVANGATATTFLVRAPGGSGIGFGPMGGLVIAAGGHGLLHVGSRPEATPLATVSDDPALRYVSAVDDFKLTPELLYLDASDRPTPPRAASALLEHAGRGSLRRYDWRSKQSTILMEGLQAPMAVAVGPDDAYALVAETGAYRILRYWLTGPRAGTHEVFVDRLPGFVTGLSFNRGGRFWATLTTGRHAGFDALAAFPCLRAALATLPWSWSWLPVADDSLAIGFDTEGQAFGAFRLKPGRDVGRMTQVVEHGAWLWIASDSADALARLPLQTLVASAPPPPPGWESAPRKARMQTAKPPEDDD